MTREQIIKGRAIVLKEAVGSALSWNECVEFVADSVNYYLRKVSISDEEKVIIRANGGFPANHELPYPNGSGE